MDEKRAVHPGLAHATKSQNPGDSALNCTSPAANYVHCHRNSDNKDKPVIDFLMSFTDYTVLVEIKTPDTPIFSGSRRGRAGTWEFSREFMSAVSQIIEQKAEWLSFAQKGEHYNRSGTELLTARTRNAKSILVIGSHGQFSRSGARDTNVMRDTFELFRMEHRSIDIVTFDELLERARFITRSS